MGPKSHVDGEACFTLSFTRHCFVVVVVVVVDVVVVAVVVVAAAAIVIAELGIHIPKKWILQTLNNSNFSTDDTAHGELGVVHCGTLCKQCGGTVPRELPTNFGHKYGHASHTLNSQKEIIERSS